MRTNPDFVMKYRIERVAGHVAMKTAIPIVIQRADGLRSVVGKLVDDLATFNKSDDGAAAEALLSRDELRFERKDGLIFAWQK